MIQFDEHIYHMGWFNHQLEYFDSFLTQLHDSMKLLGCSWIILKYQAEKRLSLEIIHNLMEDSNMINSEMYIYNIYNLIYIDI